MRTRRLLLSLGLAAVLLALLSWLGDVRLGDVAEALGRLSPRTWLLALGVHAGIYLVRASRFRLLLPRDEQPSLPAVLACSAAHNLAAYVLPAKTGEATIVVYLRAHGVRAASGLASLLVSRLFDLAVLALSVGLATLALRDRLTRPELALPLGVALLGAGALLSAACLRPSILTGGAAWILRRSGFDQRSFGAKLLARTDEVGGALKQAAQGGRLPLGFLTSAAIWALVFLFYAVLSRGAGLPESIDYLGASFGSSLAVLFNLAPINGFAGFGTQEAGWSVGFQLLGIPAALALSTGVVVHLVQLANVALFGLLGHLAMGLSGGSEAGDSEG